MQQPYKVIGNTIMFNDKPKYIVVDPPTTHNFCSKLNEAYNEGIKVINPTASKAP